MRRRHKSKFDYYHELGVEETATLAQIKRAYRILAVRYHPDKTSRESDAATQAKNEARFKRISEAYEVLSDTDGLRKQYDNYEHPAVRVPPKAGDKNTDGTKKDESSIPRRSPFVDFITNPDNVVGRVDKDGKVKFTGYQK